MQLSSDEVRLLVFYVVGFIAAGILLSAIWPLLGSGVAQYLGFSLAGAVVGIAIVAGENGGLATREPAEWVLGILVGVFMGCAFVLWLQTGCGLTNVAADKHYWIARCARIVRCACS